MEQRNLLQYNFIENLIDTHRLVSVYLKNGTRIKGIIIGQNKDFIMILNEHARHAINTQFIGVIHPNPVLKLY